MTPFSLSLFYSISLTLSSTIQQSLLPIPSDKDNKDETKDSFIVGGCSGSEREELLGCEHYRRGCMLKAACCGEFFACRKCHDLAADHKIDRSATKEMICLHCQKEQPVAQICNSCGEVLGKYYCDICMFWSNDNTQEYYHCRLCRLCYNGPRALYFHCYPCRTCLKREERQTHRCVGQDVDNMLRGVLCCLMCCGP